MARVVNSFALLGDEEGEDVTLLVENFAKKADVDPPAAQDKKQPARNQSRSQQGDGKASKLATPEFVRSDRGRGRGGRGRGSGRGGFGGNDSENFGGQENGYRRSYGDGSNGNGHDAYRGRGQGRGGGRGRGRGRGFNNEYFRDEKDGSGGNLSNVEDAADGWEQVPQTHARGYGNDVNTNRDEERSFLNGNRNYGGERRSYGSGNRGFRGRRDGLNYGRGEQSTNDELKENASADANDANGVADIAIAEGDVAVVTEEPKDVGAEEKTPEEGPKDDNPTKKDEDEDEKLMTLEEYEKLLAEKRKALEALKKIEERKVTADKDFEAMQLLEKKREEDILQKPEAAKLKKKDSLDKDDKSRKTVSINEFLKPAEGEEFSYRRPGRGRGRGRGGARSGDFRNEERGPRSNGYARGGGRAARDSPMIHIEDQGQFPVLKGAAAPAVEAA